jgi:hypothetical protein
VNGAAGSVVPAALTATRTKRIQFTQAIQPTDNVQIEIQNAGTGQWLPLTTYNVSAGISPLEIQNTLGYGIGYTVVSAQTSQIDITFGQYSYSSGATYGLAGTSWATANTAGTRWRIRRSSGIGVGELAPATISSAGYVNGQSGWVAYTPTTQGFGTISNLTAYFNRVGDTMEIKLNFTMGTVTATTAAFSLPTGYTSDTTKVLSSTTEIAGVYAGGQTLAGYTLVDVGATTNLIYFGSIWANVVTIVTPGNGSSIFNNGIVCIATAKVPIVGWS